MPQTIKSEVTIIGGGWAGLSAAVQLSQQGKQVTLYESAKQLGGRARCVAFEKHRVDNGQHLLVGAYHQTLQIMQTCGVDVAEAFFRTGMTLSLQTSRRRQYRINAAPLPAPLSLAVGLLTARGYSLTERFRSILFLLSLQKSSFILDEDTSVEELFKSQPRNVWRTLWEPLCLAALNTPANIASAQIFLNVLKDSFTHKASDADLLIPRTDLSGLFVAPAMRFIEKNHGHIHLGQRVTDLKISNGRIQGIYCGEQLVSTSQVILATPITATNRIIENQLALKDMHTQLSQFSHQPICTIYLQYDESIQLNTPMLGLSGLTAQWLFDRRHSGQKGLIAAVISAEGAHMNLDGPTLAQLVNDELMELFDWPEANEMKVLRDKRATFTASVNINKLRPQHKTSVEGLWLAGDYVQSPYPATLEAAVQSGVQCAESLLGQ